MTIGGLLISEVFGPTFQGEGPTCGRRAAFIRLGLCNLNCSWCDTPYTWDWKGEQGIPQDRSALYRVPAAELVEQVKAMDVKRVVITGGEPMVQRTQLDDLVDMLGSHGIAVEVETNGTLVPTPFLLDTVDRWNVSPKLEHSGVTEARAWRPDVLNAIAYTGHAALKVVCQTPADVRRVSELLELHSIAFRPEEVWIMPEGISERTVRGHQEQIADETLAQGFNLTTRLHVLTWGNKRGV